jgi:hypothetical protein
MKVLRFDGFNRVQDSVCILSDSNIGLSGNLVAEEGWNYYEVKSLSVKCDNNFQCDSGKCINMSQVSLF